MNSHRAYNSYPHLTTKVIAMQETAITRSRIVTIIVSLALFLAVVNCGTVDPGGGDIAIGPPVTSLPLNPNQENTIVLSTYHLKDSVDFKKMKLLYTEAFFRIEYNFELIHLPSERSLTDADAGRVDGEAMRHYDLLNDGQYSNLIRVDEWILGTETGVYSAQATSNVNNWNSLANAGQTFVIERGDKIVQVELPRHIAPDQIKDLDTVEQAINMLKAGRADVFVGTTMTAETILQRPEYSGSGIQRIGIVRTGNGYPYLHKKHSHLVPQLVAVLKEMKQDGTYQSLMGPD
ncbi:MAG: transporter substrate-binding domain-containing protein [Chloroflexi bacterium]|nr:transporter substrate-binding domain-containing protein [Chloroflexota bacterium]